jgi:multimeric flavodoxin WrbA
MIIIKMMEKDTTQKKIIALSCSPSRGRNSDTMLDYFIEGIQKVDGVNIEKIYLEDIPIDYYRYENGQCPQEHEDEFKKLVDKITNSEGLIIATPTYNFSVPAHLKNFIDRIRCIALDLSKKNKIGQPVGRLHYLSTYFIVSGGTPNWAQKLLFFAFPPFWLRAVFLYFGAKVINAVYSGDTKAFENKKILNKCKKDGYKYAWKIKRGEGHGILENIFWRPPQNH